MTEKRFTYMEQFNGFCDVYDNGKILSCMRLEYVENTVNLLNELNDEIIELQKQNNTKTDEPKYYSHNGLSPLQCFKQGLMSETELIGFCKGNVIKYVVRAGKKGNAEQDIAKAIDYLKVLREIIVGAKTLKHHHEVLELKEENKEHIIKALKELENE